MGTAAISVGAAFAARLSKWLCLFCLIIGAAVWLICYFHFCSVKYIVENKCLIIRRGILIKSTTSIAFSDILWRGAVKFGSATLFSVFHTAAGRIFVFAEMHTEIPADGEF